MSRQDEGGKNCDPAAASKKNPQPRTFLSLSFLAPSKQTNASYSLVAYRDEPAGLQKVVRDKVETVLEVLPNVSFSSLCLSNGA